LYFEKERPFLAGAALVLPFAKPHLLFFLGVVFVDRSTQEILRSQVAL
jgi:hypothetical protein